MAKYRVLKGGLSQREGPEGRLVDRAVGEIVEVSSEAADGLVEAGYLEPARTRKKEDA